MKSMFSLTEEEKYQGPKVVVRISMGDDGCGEHNWKLVSRR